MNSIELNKIALILNKKDNVAVARDSINKNTIIGYNNVLIKTLGNIPKGHRFAIKDIPDSENVMQYGYSFGISKGIKSGELIEREKINTIKIDLNKLIDIKIKYYKKYFDEKISIRTFKGYKRKNNLIGTRNYYAIIPTSLCASDTAVKISDKMKNKLGEYEKIDGIVAAAHTEGCGCNDGDIINRLLLTLKNTILNSNVGGVLIIDLGCEKTNLKTIKQFFNSLKNCGKPIDFLSIIEEGGTGNILRKADIIISKRLRQINDINRYYYKINNLIIGTECGASDSFSGITANPLIGHVVDKIIKFGGSAILSEIPEMVGAEEILAKRMINRKVLKKFIDGMTYYQNLAKKLNVSLEGNFVYGNLKGGLLNPVLKSLGAITKGGNNPIVDFLDYGEVIKIKGLSLMNGPGNDLESMTGLVAGGANMILFSTGAGTTEGNLICPVIKISSTSEVYKKMSEDIDFDAGKIISENISFDDLSERLVDYMISVASGEKTCSEKWDKHSFQIWSAGKLSL